MKIKVRTGYQNGTLKWLFKKSKKGERCKATAMQKDK